MENGQKNKLNILKEKLCDTDYTYFCYLAIIMVFIVNHNKYMTVFSDFITGCLICVGKILTG